MDGIAVGLTKGHVVTKREGAARPSRRRGALSQRIKKVWLQGLGFEFARCAESAMYGLAAFSRARLDQVLREPRTRSLLPCVNLF
jgi:hypothetical protein